MRACARPPAMSDRLMEADKTPCAHANAPPCKRKRRGRARARHRRLPWWQGCNGRCAAAEFAIAGRVDVVPRCARGVAQNTAPPAAKGRICVRLPCCVCVRAGGVGVSACPAVQQRNVPAGAAARSSSQARSRGMHAHTRAVHAASVGTAMGMHVSNLISYLI